MNNNCTCIKRTNQHQDEVRFARQENSEENDHANACTDQNNNLHVKSMF
jgi:hypothetical protein